MFPEGRPTENGVVFVVLVACLFGSAGSSVGGALLQRQRHGEAGAMKNVMHNYA